MTAEGDEGSRKLITNERTKLLTESRAVSAAPSLDEVARLSALLAKKVVSSRGVISADEAVALAKAARLLQDHDVEWPEILAQAIYELAEEKPAPSAPNDVVVQSSVNGVVISMASFAARARLQSR